MPTANYLLTADCLIAANCLLLLLIELRGFLVFFFWKNYIHALAGID